MTGTVDSSTTERIRPAPPRGMSTSTCPRARISALTLSWESPGTSWTTSGSRPADGHRVAEHRDDRGVARPGAGAAAQEHGVAGLQADAGGVGGHVGTGLVDHPDHAERHPHLAQLEPVGERAAADHLADRVGQPGDVAQPLGHRGQPVGGQPEPVDDVRRGAAGLGALDVLGVGGQDLLLAVEQRVGHREEGGVLLRSGRQGQAVTGLAGALGDGEDLLLGVHAASVVGPPRDARPVLSDKQPNRWPARRTLNRLNAARCHRGRTLRCSAPPRALSGSPPSSR